MEDSYKDVVSKCDLELVFLKCWAFGKIKKIHGPTGILKTDTRAKPDGTNPPVEDVVIPGSDKNMDVVPGNVRKTNLRY